MRAQVSLTTAESKKLIAKAVATMDIVKRALNGGMVVMHPSSSTIFVAEEITGQRPSTDVWVCGMIVPKGACIELASSRVYIHGHKSVPSAFPACWVVKDGKLMTGIPLGSLLEQMGPDDVYVKGVNALDMQGNVGILAANEVEGGAFGVVMAALRRKSFKVVFPAGLEKLIPVTIREATKEALRTRLDYSMGVACSLVPCEGGTVVTEVEAIRILSGATAMPIAAGGLAGAEGAITLIIKGEAEQVNPAVKYVEEVKGAKLPEVRLRSCAECEDRGCSLVGGKKHWISI